MPYDLIIVFCLIAFSWALGAVGGFLAGAAKANNRHAAMLAEFMAQG
jgi:hypothetical protein